MRKAQKQQIEEFLKVLQQAHSEVKQQIEGHYLDETLEILEQCQQGAVQAGELIESIEGEECITIRLLEGYCEIVYQLYEEISQERTDRFNIIYKSLCKYLIKIENSVKNDIKIRKEVVFLPYKASMWDSLESVWQAAEADSDCDAYVIPIPYYDRETDGSFCEMHYEGNLYPDYVPVIRYENYDFEKRKPDMIFIHNPYDEYNYVTSVAPFFYSGNLKKYTEQLIYISYFILGEINNPEDPAALDGIAQYCITQGVMNADKVIVQSENMRRAYINVLTRQMGEETKGYWEEKILGLGSPKIDKVLSTRKEDLVIPKEWIKILKKPDGQFKKVIFYNTGVTALLKHEEKLLKKIRDVMKIFKENQDEVALLWRPHPLMFTTLRSMRPQLLREYEEIVAEYREEGWGIYDDTADMDRAICLSDAYYGDGSSIVWLYQAANKSVMIQDIEVLSEKVNHQEFYSKPVAVDMVENNEKIWMALIDRNGICEVDKITKKARICKIFEGESIDREWLYNHVEKVGNYLIFSPGVANRIAIYDLHQDVINYIPLRELKFHCKQNQNESRFWNTLRYYSDVYLFGYSYPAIIRINTETMEITYITNWVKEIDDMLEDGDFKGYFGNGHFIINELIIVPFSCGKAVLELNTNTMKTKILKLDISMEGVGGLCSADGENVWLVGKGHATNRIAYWNRRTNIINEFQVPDMKGDIFEAFYEPICTSSKIYFMPMSAPNIYEIEPGIEEVNKSNILKSNLNNIEDPLSLGWKTIAPRIQDHQICFLTCDDFGWNEYNLENQQLKKYYIFLEEYESNRYFKAIYLQSKIENKILIERKIPIKYVLKKIIESDSHDYNKKNIILSIGEDIYRWFE